MSGDIPMQPPVPFADFDFGFDPHLSNIFPSPPPLPSSADLFSSGETNDLLGFLDNFNWEFDIGLEQQNDNPVTTIHHPTHSSPPYPNLHIDAAPQRPNTRSRASGGGHSVNALESTSPTSATPANFNLSNADQDQSIARSKPILSTPQKRLNHIMSEQKRRNAIRDGYVQLTALLAPAGAPPGTGMPTRGRPKGSGNRGKGRCQGKSGILFRAVEYCRWMEENVDALEREVLRVEAAAGVHGV